jgi:hypothetical protein
MTRFVSASLIAGASSLVLLTALQAAQGVSPPKARYVMDVGTNSGFAAMAGRGGMGGGMGMMFGGGGDKLAYELRLRLGSTLLPDKGPAKADHFFMPPAKLGKSVPLMAPDRAPSDVPENFQKPKGRMLLFWGCGAHAPKGQPVVIDFAKVAAGQMPPGLMSVRVPVDHGPTLANSKTYAEWPNKKSGKMPSSGSSLLGEHRVAANFAPEVKFSLAQDYMPPVNASSVASPLGGIALRWNSVAGATGYHAWVMGMKMNMEAGEVQDMVWWSSSAAREFGGGLWDWLPPATVARLIGEKVVMPPSQTTCTIPAEVKAAAPNMMMANLYAYGPQAEFAYPPRPATGVWNPDWTASVRFRSYTSLMLVSPMAGMQGAGAQGDQPRCKPSILGAALGRGC